MTKAKVFLIGRNSAILCAPLYPGGVVSSCEFSVKKQAWGGGGMRNVKFVEGPATDLAVLTTNNKTLTVTVGPGLPADTSKCLPFNKEPTKGAFENIFYVYGSIKILQGGTCSH